MCVLAGRPAPPKPWERQGSAGVSTTTPLGPSTANDGAPKPWETATPSAFPDPADSPSVALQDHFCLIVCTWEVGVHFLIRCPL